MCDVVAGSMPMVCAFKVKSQVNVGKLHYPSELQLCILSPFHNISGCSIKNY